MLARESWPASSEATPGLVLRSGTPAGQCRAAASCRVSTPGRAWVQRHRRHRVGLGALRWHQQVDGGHVGDDREGEQLSDRDVLPPGYLQVGRIDRLMWCMPVSYTHLRAHE